MKDFQSMAEETRCLVQKEIENKGNRPDYILEKQLYFILDEPTGVAGTRRKKEIHRARIYCITGYYDENETYIPRPDCLDLVNNEGYKLC